MPKDRGVPYEELSDYEKIRYLGNLGSYAERDAIIKKWSVDESAELRYQWLHYARNKQKPPPGDWATWLLRAGRGFGKTRTGAGWVQMRAMERPGRLIALVARTPADARDYMIIGPGGILKNTAPEERPTYNASNRALIWPNGSRATIYSDEVPDQLRGFSGDTAWLDEFAKYAHPNDTWDNLAFGMREKSSDQPRKLITTTPRPLAILRAIEKLSSTVVVIGSSYENQTNLDAKWFEELLRYEGSRLGRQEIDAEIIDDAPGALWTRGLIEKSLVPFAPSEFGRVVVGVDPSGTAGGEDGGNRVGIVCVGLKEGVAYILDDWTCALSPHGWGRKVVELASYHNADRIVAEKNFGGAMVEHVIRTAEPSASIKMVQASRGKVIRAEPVAALYEQGKVKHVKAFPELEDQMCSMVAPSATEPGGYIGGDGSPDRLDAMVWAVTDLMLQKRWQTELPVETGLPIVR